MVLVTWLPLGVTVTALFSGSLFIRRLASQVGSSSSLSTVQTLGEDPTQSFARNEALDTPSRVT